jgi:hypothetical protein
VDDSIAGHAVSVVADKVGEVLRELHDDLADEGVQAQCTHLQVQLPDDRVVEVRYDPDPPEGQPILIEAVHPA